MKLWFGFMVVDIKWVQDMISYIKELLLLKIM